MAVVAYKCPNCGAPLEFSPESQRFECSFCGSSFSEEELQEYEPAQSSEQTIVQEPAGEKRRQSFSTPARAAALRSSPLKQQRRPAACTVTARWCWKAVCRESSIPTV